VDARTRAKSGVTVRTRAKLAGRVLPGSNRLWIAICARQRTPERRPALVLHAGSRHRTEAGVTVSGTGGERPSA
jgi:hypothetical protein